jgi:hypothetical protein
MSQIRITNRKAEHKLEKRGFTDKISLVKDCPKNLPFELK